MVSKKDLKDYDFKSIERYFEYITESILNGQRSQAKELISKLSKDQKKLALKYLMYRDSGEAKEAKQIILELI